MDDQPEATVRAGHTGHGRVLFEGDLLDCLAANRAHVGASRVWIGVVAMTLPKGSRRPAAVDDGRPRKAKRGMRYGALAGRVRPSRLSHPGLDPQGGEWLRKVVG